MKPIPMLIDTDKFFPNFFWFAEGRPKNFADIFRKTPRPKAPGATSEEPQEGQSENQPPMTEATLSTTKEE